MGSQGFALALSSPQILLSRYDRVLSTARLSHSCHAARTAVTILSPASRHQPASPSRLPKNSDTFRLVFKIAGKSVPQRCSAGGAVSPLQQSPSLSAQRVVRQLFRWTPPVVTAPRLHHPLNPVLAAKFKALAQNQQMQTSAFPVQSQPSGTLEQEEVHVDIPLGLRTPNKYEGRKSLTGNYNQEPAAAVGDLEYSGHQTLADRIKSRSRRSTNHSSLQVPSAAVNALAETIGAAIATNTGASERYLDSRDADHNVPGDIPGVSDEQIQIQHRQQPAATSQAAVGVGKAASIDDRRQGAATPAQVKPKRPRKGSKAALLQTAAELAQSPDVSEDVLQEDKQVCTAL